MVQVTSATSRDGRVEGGEKRGSYKRMGWLWVMSVLLLAVSCESIAPQKPKVNPEVEAALKSADQLGPKTLALVWTSQDGLSFHTSLIAYRPDGAVEHLSEADELLLWVGDGLWMLKETTKRVKEGDCACGPNCSREVDKPNLYLAKRGGRTIYVLTDPFSIGYASYEQTTRVIGSFGGYLFGLVCSEYEYCSGDEDQPACEYVGYDLEKGQQVGTDRFFGPYAFEDQMKAYFPEILDKGGAMTGDVYPLYAVPRWNSKGDGAWDTFYRVRVRGRDAKKGVVTFEETLRRGAALEEKVRVPTVDPEIATLLSRGSYGGVSYLPQEQLKGVLELMVAKGEK